MSIGLWENGLNRYSRAIELDPMPLNFVNWYNLRAKCCGFLGRFEQAVDYIEEALEIQPDLAFYITYTWQLIMQKKYDEANAQIAIMKKLTPDSQDVRRYQALWYAATGDKERALSLIQRDDEKYGYIFTTIYALLGMKEEALKNIERGIDVGFEKSQSCYYPFPYLQNNPCLETLRNDPRFLKIMNEAKRNYDLKLIRFGDLGT